MENKQWPAVVQSFRDLLQQFKTIKEVAASLGLSTITVRKILNGGNVALMVQIKVEGWVKKNREKQGL